MKPWHNRSVLLILMALSTLSTARDTITPTQPLAFNETLVSSNGHFALGFFTPGNSSNHYLGIWYNQVSIPTILWVANRENPVTNSNGTLSITADGILSITDSVSTVIWSTSTLNVTYPSAELLDTGNFVVASNKNSSDSYAWQSFDYPTDTLIPGMKLGIDHTTGLSWNLTAWRSADDPSPGDCHLLMDNNGVPEMYMYATKFKEWRSGPWNGHQFSGIADIVNNQDFTFSFVNIPQQVSYSYQITNQSTISRLVVDQSGLVQQWLWGRNQWIVVWYAPKDKCDEMGQCGPYGVCDSNNSPICSCLQGFVPTSSANWGLRDWSNGCIRMTELDCRNGSDGFLILKELKLPDTSNSEIYMKLAPDGCRVLCMVNCLCTAFAIFSDNVGGCIIWLSELSDIRLETGTGQDLYVRLAAADLASPKRHISRIKMVAIVVSLLFGILLLACVGLFLWKRKKRRKEVIDVNNYLEDKSNEVAGVNGLDLPLVDFGTIITATDNFSAGNKLGQGGFGPVYKGKLGVDQEIAVKRLSTTSQQGVDEFKNEVMLIAKLQHRNLVRLLGCCIQGEERMLIYEYMLNKSLDTFLFDKTKGATLDWQTRHRIIIGITRGILYLHHDSRLRIIHRDLKASNVLLDMDMNPKISDFGMARIFGGGDGDFNTRKVVGTYGYMSPEYAMEGIFSVKSDVFSFGVILLEIISGKKNRGEYAFSSHLNLVAHAWSLWNEGKSLLLVDESLNKSFPMDEVLKCIKIGLLCVQESPEDRPLISSVIQMLDCDIAKLPQPKQPGFVARMCPLEADPPPRVKETTSNEMTVSKLEGR